jgi:hypothetical protein
MRLALGPAVEENEMTKYLLTIDYNGGAIETPMYEWSRADIKAHMDYYRALDAELTGTGELLQNTALTGPELAKIVTSDGTAPVITDGPFAEFKEMLAGFQLVDVETEERAIEIAALISRVPGPGGVPTEQPVMVRRLMSAADFKQISPDL